MKEYSIGIDSGSVATKAVLFDGQKIIKKVIIPTGWSPKRTSLEAYNLLTDKVDKDKIKKVIGTGYGRVSMDFVDKKVTEITLLSCPPISSMVLISLFKKNIPFV